jgi:hypothetical protein
MNLGEQALDILGQPADAHELGRHPQAQLYAAASSPRLDDARVARTELELVGEALGRVSLPAVEPHDVSERQPSAGVLSLHPCTGERAKQLVDAPRERPRAISAKTENIKE